MADLLQLASPGGLCIQSIADRMPLSHRPHLLKLIEDLPPTFVRGAGVCAGCQQAAHVTKYA
jgi:hypothetical protein